MFPCLVIIVILAYSDFVSKKHLSALLRRITESSSNSGFSEDILIFALQKDFSVSAFGFFEVGFETMSRVSIDLSN